MCAEVGAKIEVKGELLAADLAVVGLIAGVHEHVSLQLRIVQETFPACVHRTKVLSFSMSHHVLPQCAVIPKAFVAIRVLTHIRPAPHYLYISLSFK